MTSAMIGIHWDISWHRSIGRDTFWTPAHLVIHLCGVLAGISCGYLILSTTFRRNSPLRDCAVRMWGFRGPLGAFLSAWGGVAMLTSAPFDNWWHNAYGLDVKILSPPHMVLAAGIFAVHAGALLLILGQMNRAEGVQRARLQWLFLYVGGMILVCLSVLQMEITSRSSMHSAHFYRLVAMVAPPVMAGVARASKFKWAATAIAGVYTLFVLLMSWILPLFPAQPKLGPVYHHLTQFTPPEFPVLFVVPALALDLLWQRTGNWSIWRRAVVSGAVFVLALAAVQWPFASFLMTPAARNWFFGTHYFGYYVPATSLYARYQFFPPEPVFWQEAAAALATAIVTTALGLAWGNWMQKIRR
ncbi:conserved membrane hypothetical protein [Candidatus Sulfopaludibacter sp. SbA3]|nr:conserved membrane hypothetical protein [Candidatus Sulfopaludibacter sp. SbA3]